MNINVTDPADASPPIQAKSKTWADLAVGDAATLSRLCVADDLAVFAHASGNMNPIHLGGSPEGEPARAPAMWVGGLISAVLGNLLPGPGTIYRSQTLTFNGAVHVGDELRIGVRVAEKRTQPEVMFDTFVDRADGTRLCEGVAVVNAPPSPLDLPDPEDVPRLLVRRHRHIDALLERARPLPPVRTAVVAPEEPNSLGGAVLAHREGIIHAVFIGSALKIKAAAVEGGLDISDIEIIDIPGHPAAAARSVAMVHEGGVSAIMKGHLHTDELLRHVVKRDGGLRTGRRLSHAFVLDVPGQPRPLVISDAAINIAPDLEAKVDIVQNAIDVARAVGIEAPRVALLSAVETVNSKIPSTLDAAILAKMADRGQIRGGIVDGPLAMDNAMSLDAARTKGIESAVAGRADVLIAPNLESSNMIVKQLTFVAHAEGGGLVLGATAPVVLTSRADDPKVRLGSCAIAALVHHWAGEQKAGDEQ